MGGMKPPRSQNRGYEAPIRSTVRLLKAPKPQNRGVQALECHTRRPKRPQLRIMAPIWFQDQVNQPSPSNCIPCPLHQGGGNEGHRPALSSFGRLNEDHQGGLCFAWIRGSKQAYKIQNSPNFILSRRSQNQPTSPPLPFIEIAGLPRTDCTYNEGIFQQVPR